MTEGLVRGEGFAIDASVIKADANRQKGVPGAHAAWDRESPLTRPVREYLEALDDARCVLACGAHQQSTLVHWLLALDVEFEVLEPPSLRDLLQAVTEQQVGETRAEQVVERRERLVHQ